MRDGDLWVVYRHRNDASRVLVIPNGPRQPKSAFYGRGVARNRVTA